MKIKVKTGVHFLVVDVPEADRKDFQKLEDSIRTVDSTGSSFSPYRCFLVCEGAVSRCNHDSGTRYQKVSQLEYLAVISGNAELEMEEKKLEVLGMDITFSEDKKEMTIGCQKFNKNQLEKIKDLLHEGVEIKFDDQVLTGGHDMDLIREVLSEME